MVIQIHAKQQPKHPQALKTRVVHLLLNVWETIKKMFRLYFIQSKKEIRNDILLKESEVHFWTT